MLWYFNFIEVVNSSCVELVSVFVIVIFRIWKVSFMFWIDGLSVVLLVPTIITIRSETSSRSGAYFSSFSCIFWCKIELETHGKNEQTS